MTWYDTSYLHKRKITIDHTQVSGSSDLVDFPVLISNTDTDFKTVANGGLIQDANGFDIIFTNDAEDTQLDHEIELFDAVNGIIVMWVRIPTLSYTADTIIYLYYDNSSISTSQENKTGVWDSNFVAVWHSGETAGTALIDSTSNGADGTKVSETSPSPSSTGEIDGAQLYTASASDSVDVSPVASLIATGSFTISLWFCPTATFDDSSTPNQSLFALGDASSNNDTSLFLEALAGKLSFAHTIAYTIYTTQTTWTSGTWYKVDAVCSDGVGAFLYVDGGFITSDALGPRGETASTDAFLGKFIAPPYPQNFFDGTIDEVRISNSPRSADWIATEYASENAPSSFYALGTSLSVGSCLSNAEEAAYDALMASLARNQNTAWLGDCHDQLRAYRGLCNAIILSDTLAQEYWRYALGCGGVPSMITTLLSLDPTTLPLTNDIALTGTCNNTDVRLSQETWDYYMYTIDYALAYPGSCEYDTIMALYSVVIGM